jgi:hypothetical protein
MYVRYLNEIQRLKGDQTQLATALDDERLKLALMQDSLREKESQAKR